MIKIFMKIICKDYLSNNYLGMIFLVIDLLKMGFSILDIFQAINYY